MKILLLGNGFDLYHKFPTRYDNFLHTVDFLLQYYDEESMLTIGDIFGDKRLLENDSFIPYCYTAYKDAYDSISVDKEKIKSITSIAKDNIWFKYFLTSYNKELGWIDFEREISKVVHAFEDFFFDYDDVNDVTLPDDDVDKYIIHKFDFFLRYKPKAASRSGIGLIPEKYVVLNEYKLEEPYGSKIYIIDKGKIISKLYKELLELSEVLRLYLIVFVNNAIDIILKTNRINKISDFNQSHITVTFNYTDTFEKMYCGNNIFHIHGKLDDKIILGINPDENDEVDRHSYADTDFLQFKKYYQRVLNGSDLRYLKEIKDIKLEKSQIGLLPYEKIILFVVGHSLDFTDEDIIKEIFSVSDKIYIICYNEKAIADSINNLVKIYGKNEFDSIRSRTDMEFKLYSDFE